VGLPTECAVYIKGYSGDGYSDRMTHSTLSWMQFLDNTSPTLCITTATAFKGQLPQKEYFPMFGTTRTVIHTDNPKGLRQYSSGHFPSELLAPRVHSLCGLLEIKVELTFLTNMPMEILNSVTGYYPARGA